jgi:ribosomal protein S12 methylthiotransferase
MKIYIKKLGCPKNDVDADYLAGKLMENGHELVLTEARAEAVIVNTCGFIEPAKEESVDEILRYEKMKEEGQIDKLIITGCLSQRYAADLVKEIPSADGIFGLGIFDDLLPALNNEYKSPVVKIKQAKQLDYLAGTNRYVGGDRPYEYVKIADGCDRYCAYCAIPYIRGRYRSRPMESIIDEARLLGEKGIRELILVSQEGTGYGRDLGYKDGIIGLLKELEKILEVKWLRLMYLHPEAVTDELIEYMSRSEKTLGYFDIPLQHINDKMLKLMNRPVRRAVIEEKLIRIRRGSAENIIRTTFIAGHPGETEREFEELKEFIVEFRFDRLGVFSYSAEEDTAAFGYEGRVDEDIIEARQDELMALQQEIAFEKNIALIGKNIEIIIDDIKSERMAIGRSKGDCPEIDQVVYVSGAGMTAGDILEVRVTAAEGYDLIARPERSYESDQ